MFKQNCTRTNRQHHSCCLHKQGRRHEVGPTVCTIVVNSDLVLNKSGDPQGQTHSRLAECGSRQAVQAGPDHPNKVVLPSRDLLVDMNQLAPISNRPICNKVQQQVASVCVANSRRPSQASRCTQSTLEGPGSICLPTSSHSGQAGGEAKGQPVQKDHPDCSRVAQHALVQGPSSYVKL